MNRCSLADAAGREGSGDLHCGTPINGTGTRPPRGFDGYKSHAAVDPDSEIITATTVTPGNAGVAETSSPTFLDDTANHVEPPPVVRRRSSRERV